jgi:RNA polymerase-binding transcription factor DksA
LLTEREEMQEQLRQLETDEYEGVGYGNHMVDRALTKLDDGTYGICEHCGGRIDRARLEALPQAIYCLECQAKHEHRVLAR